MGCNPPSGTIRSQQRQGDKRHTYQQVRDPWQAARCLPDSVAAIQSNRFGRAKSGTLWDLTQPLLSIILICLHGPGDALVFSLDRVASQICAQMSRCPIAKNYCHPRLPSLLLLAFMLLKHQILAAESLFASSVVSTCPLCRSAFRHYDVITGVWHIVDASVAPPPQS